MLLSSRGKHCGQRFEAVDKEGWVILGFFEWLPMWRKVARTRAEKSQRWREIPGLELVVSYLAGRKHLPVILLKPVA